MRAHDWRRASADTLAPVYAAEIDRWRHELAWDTARIWSRVEAARQRGGVPGLIVTDHGGVRGWSFHLLHEDTLQVGALVTDGAESTRAWLDALTASPEALTARRWLCFGWFRAPGVAEALGQAGLAVRHYRYLRHDTTAGPARRGRRFPFRQWHTDDRLRAAALLAAGYPGADTARPFAPDGSAAEWEAYTRALVEGDANGTPAPERCALLDGEDGQLDAMAVVTRLAPATQHLAQLVVRPRLHGQGVGQALLEHVLASGCAAGCRTTTLLVHEDNHAARALYQSAGFADAATFLSAAGTLRP